MSNAELQLDEMVNAIQQVVNVQEFKSRKQVLDLIQTGVDSNKNPAEILSIVLDWCGNG